MSIFKLLVWNKNIFMWCFWAFYFSIWKWTFKFEFSSELGISVLLLFTSSLGILKLLYCYQKEKWTWEKFDTSSIKSSNFSFSKPGSILKNFVSQVFLSTYWLLSVLLLLTISNLIKIKIYSYSLTCHNEIRSPL